MVESKPAFNAPAAKKAPTRPSPPAPPMNRELKASAPAYDFSLDERIKLVQDCLMKASEGIGRAAILKETKLTTAQFNDTIAALREDGKVEKTGEKRGTKWHWVADKGFPPSAIVDVSAPFAPPTAMPTANGGAQTVSEHDLNVAIEKVMNSGVGFMEVTTFVQEKTGCPTAFQALAEGKLTKDILIQISELA